MITRLAFAVSLVGMSLLSQARGDDLTVFGRVVDASGKPVVGAELASYWSGEEGVLKEYKAVCTDAEGRFSIKPRRDNRPMTVLALDKERKTGGIFSVDAKSIGKLIVVKMEALVHVKGSFYCREMNFKPTWTNVYIMTPDGERFLGDSSDKAAFSLLLPPGKYKFWGYGTDIEGVKQDLTISADQPVLDMKTIDARPTTIARNKGKEPPKWFVTDARGVKKDVTIGDFKGKWVLVDFFTYWCGPCVANSLPQLIDIYDRHKDHRDKFEILAFHVGYAKNFQEYDQFIKEAKKNFWKDKDLPFPLLLDATEQTMKSFGISSFPTKILIDPDGKLVGEVNEYELEKRLPFVSDRSEVQPSPNGGRVALLLTPSDYAKPVSRHYLLPEVREAIPGNRVQMFLRCFMEQDSFFGREESERREKWNAMPLKDLPIADLKYYGGTLIVREMYDAARMTNADWQPLYFARRDGYEWLIPDVQKMRALASAMKTRVRGEIAAGDFEGAIRTLKTMFGLARTMESHPTLIGSLVGIWIADIAADAIEELIAQPAAPNLFWALSNLPTPLLSLRTGTEGERLFISSDFEDLKNSDDPVPDSAIRRKIDRYAELIKQGTIGEGPSEPALTSLKPRLEARAKDADDVRAARARLLEAGMKVERVILWSPLHIVLLDTVLIYEQFRDETAKWLNLPYWQVKSALEDAQVEVKKAIRKSEFLEMMPRFFRAKTAQACLDQRIALLEIIEAIRLYAFSRSGTLPATLAEIKLPLPIDPLSGKPFEYSVKDGVATLGGIDRNPRPDRTNRYYEIQIRKSNH
jgi:thiol-disulfide isomerase/thioredoxin